jgi:signal transduction histidine kinase
LANSLKHARARAVAVRLQAGDELLLTIVDDGAGGVDAQGTGLVNLRDRLAAVGGSLALDDRGSGTRLVARVPRTGHAAAQPIRT